MRCQLDLGLMPRGYSAMDCRIAIPFTLMLATTLIAEAREVYQCTEPDGSTVFSDTPCAATVDELETIQLFVPPPPPEPPSQTAASSARDDALEREYEQYMEERERLVNQRNRLIRRHQQRGLSQTFTQMHQSKAKIDALRFEIEALDIAWEDRIDPAGARERAERREISAQLDRIERRQRREQRNQILQRHQPTYLRNCRTMGTSTIICD